MTATHNALVTLFATLANHGIMVVAWYQRENVIGLVIASGQVVEAERRFACGQPTAFAELLASHLPRKTVPRDYDSSNVPEIAPLTARWWAFLRWECERRGQVEVRG